MLFLNALCLIFTFLRLSLAHSLVDGFQQTAQMGCAVANGCFVIGSHSSITTSADHVTKRQVGAEVYATIDGVLVSWANNWNGFSAVPVPESTSQGAISVSVETETVTDYVTITDFETVVEPAPTPMSSSSKSKTKSRPSTATSTSHSSDESSAGAKTHTSEEFTTVTSLETVRITLTSIHTTSMSESIESPTSWTVLSTESDGKSTSSALPMYTWSQPSTSSFTTLPKSTSSAEATRTSTPSSSTSSSTKSHSSSSSLSTSTKSHLSTTSTSPSTSSSSKALSSTTSKTSSTKAHPSSTSTTTSTASSPSKSLTSSTSKTSSTKSHPSSTLTTTSTSSSSSKSLTSSTFTTSTASTSTSSSSSAAAPTSTIDPYNQPCNFTTFVNDSGFEINFDDYSPFNMSDDLSYYHDFFWSSGYTFKSASEQPYEPYTLPYVAEYCPPEDLIALDRDGLIGSGPNFQDQTWSFTAYSMRVGCLSPSPDDTCVFRISGYRPLLPTSTMSTLGTYEHFNVSALGCATADQSECTMSYLYLDSTAFSGLSDLRIEARVSGTEEKVSFVLDVLFLGWDNTTCAADVVRAKYVPPKGAKE